MGKHLTLILINLIRVVDMVYIIPGSYVVGEVAVLRTISLSISLICVMREA